MKIMAEIEAEAVGEIQMFGARGMSVYVQMVAEQACTSPLMTCSSCRHCMVVHDERRLCSAGYGDHLPHGHFCSVWEPVETKEDAA